MCGGGGVEGTNLQAWRVRQREKMLFGGTDYISTILDCGHFLGVKQLHCQSKFNKGADENRKLKFLKKYNKD